MFVDQVCVIELKDHKAVLPKDYVQINQVLFKSCGTEESLIEELKRIMNLEKVADNPALQHMNNPTGLPKAAAALHNDFFLEYKPMRKSTSTVTKSVHLTNLNEPLYKQPEVSYEYLEEPGGYLTSTLRNGILLVSYKGFPVDEDGQCLIPDHPEFRQAVMFYCLYMYWLSRSMTSEAGSTQQRDYFKQEFYTARMRAKSLELPDLGTYENLLHIHTRLVPRLHRFDYFYTNMPYKENTI